jgi:HSP20 family molecular chaperone IbpA
MAVVAVKKSDSFWDQIQKMEERVMHRAHEIFRGNGANSGNDLDHWLTAERELIWKPSIQLQEKNNKFELKINVAGLDAKDLKVEVTRDSLLVRGETERRKKEDKGEIHISEFHSGSLFRSVSFPKPVDPDKVKAELKNGLLMVTAPIAEPAKLGKAQKA